MLSLYLSFSNDSSAKNLVKQKLFDLDRHELSKQNADLRRQLAQHKDLTEENAMLHNELLRQRSESEKKAPVHQQNVTDRQQSQNKPIYPDVTSEAHQPSAKSTKPKPVASPNPQESEEEAALRAEVAHYREQNTELLGRYEKLIAEMKRKKIDSFEALAEYDKDSMKVLLELARLTPPVPLEGNIGLFGSTSTGKSTMLNALLGQKIAATGVGETTKEIKAYPGTGFTLWDVPGRNDEVSYLSMEYISFFKGLTRRLVLIQATVKENTSMMKLLDAIGLQYDVVFNKFDKVEPEEQTAVKEQIQAEIKQIGLKGFENVLFVSSKHPSMFSDWNILVQHLNNRSS
jgi:small GTP-binding protein